MSKITIPESHTCPTCGYTWWHGFDGSHSCSVLLGKRVSELEEKLKLSTEKLAKYEKEELHRIVRMLVEDHLLVLWGKDPRHTDELKKFWLDA